MSLESHVTELRKKHRALEEQIETEQRSPGSDDLDLQHMKREKLKLKDEIERLKPTIN